MPEEPIKKIQFADEAITNAGKIAEEAGKSSFEKQKEIFERINGTPENLVSSDSSSTYTPETAPTTPTERKPSAPSVVIKNLRTFQGDAAEAIKNQNASVLTIALAERKKREKRVEAEPTIEEERINEIARIMGSRVQRTNKAPVSPNPVSTPNVSIVSSVSTPVTVMPIMQSGPSEPRKKIDKQLIKNVVTVGISVLLIVLGIGAVAGFYILQKKSPTIDTPLPIDQTLIPFNTKESLSTAGIGREELIVSLNKIRQEQRSENEVTYVALTKESQNQTVPIGTAEFLSILKTSIPGTASRAFANQFMFGMYRLGGNQPFLLIKLSSFDNAFAGMLTWEKTMNTDLGSIFSLRSIPITTPAANPNTNVGEQATSTGSITRIVNTDTSVRQEFEDITIQNKDARVLKTLRGDVVLLYSFIDQNTLLITSSESALHEILNKYLAGKLVR